MEYTTLNACLSPVPLPAASESIRFKQISKLQRKKKEETLHTNHKVHITTNNVNEILQQYYQPNKVYYTKIPTSYVHANKQHTLSNSRSPF